MRSLLRMACWVCAFAFSCWLSTQAFAQGGATPPTEPRPVASSVVQEVKPEAYYLKDAQGKLQLVPNMTLEDFNELYLLSKGLKSEPPAFTLSGLKISGQVRGTKAEFDIELSVARRTKVDGWVRVPLRFNNAVLQEQPKYEGSGEVFFDYEPEGEGYVCWLKAKDQANHTLRCKFVSKVEELGAESKVTVIAPTSGSLTLRVPQSKVKARGIRRTEESSLDVSSEGSGSRIEMLAPAGESQIAWRASAEATPRVRQTIVANGSMLVRLEGKRRITCEARLKISTFGAAAEAFTVRLPPGMSLVPLDQPGMQFTVLEPEVDEVSNKQIQVVEVRLAAKTNGPIEVPLVAEYLRDSTSNDLPIEIAGFEVVDAVKQWGVIDLLVDGDQSAVWLEGANVRRLDEVLTAESRTTKALARFEYDAQPFSLQVQVVPKKTRVTVEPQYIVYVESQQLRLDATLKYKVRGAKTFNLEHDFDGWTIDRVGPDTLVQSESLLPERSSPLTIPLIASALPANGEFEIKVLAHRDLPLDARELKFDVPRPVGGNLTPGSLVVVPADNIDLTTRLGDLQGLVADPLPSTLKLPVRQQTPQFYRELGGGTTARFSGSMDVRKRMVSVASTGDIKIDLGRATIQQRLTYNISYESLRNLELDVPKALWETGQIQILLEGTALPVSQLPPSPTQTVVDPTRTRVRVDLVSDRIGRLDLEVRYPLALPQLADGATPLAIPLTAPIVEGVAVKSSVTLRMTHSERLDVAAEDPAWTVSQPFQPSGVREPETNWTHATGATELPLLLTLTQATSTGGIVIEQAWLQSWLGSERRQDRAVFRISTAVDRLQVRMPPGVRESDLLAAVDGRRVSRRLLDVDGLLTIDLPAAAALSTRVVELWYDVERRANAGGMLELEPPIILGAGEARRGYWQLITPASQYLIDTPGNLAADMRWQWSGSHLRRMGRLSQSDLERWSGASMQADLPASVNAALFSSFGSLPKISVRVASRRIALLVCSGLVLAIGLVLLYVPLARHPLVLLVLGVGVGAAALWSPDVAILAGQASLAGVACVLLSRLLLSLYGRRVGVAVSVRAPSPSAIEAKSTEPHMRYDPGSQATTATAPLVVVSSAESEG